MEFDDVLCAIVITGFPTGTDDVVVRPRRGEGEEKEETIKVKLDKFSSELVFVWWKFQLESFLLLDSIYLFSFPIGYLHREFLFRKLKERKKSGEWNALWKLRSCFFFIPNYLISLDCLTRHFWLVNILQFSKRTGVGSSKRNENCIFNGI